MGLGPVGLGWICLLRRIRPVESPFQSTLGLLHRRMTVLTQSLGAGWTRRNLDHLSRTEIGLVILRGVFLSLLGRQRSLAGAKSRIFALQGFLACRSMVTSGQTLMEILFGETSGFVNRSLIKILLDRSQDLF